MWAGAQGVIKYAYKALATPLSETLCYEIEIKYGEKDGTYNETLQSMHSVTYQFMWINISGERACVPDGDFPDTVGPCCEDMTFLTLASSALIAQPGPKRNPHTGHDTLAENRADHRPTEWPGLAHGLPLYTSTLLCPHSCDRFQCTGTDNSLVIAC